MGHSDRPFVYLKKKNTFVSWYINKIIPVSIALNRTAVSAEFECEHYHPAIASTETLQVNGEEVSTKNI